MMDVKMIYLVLIPMETIALITITTQTGAANMTLLTSIHIDNAVSVLMKTYHHVQMTYHQLIYMVMIAMTITKT